MNKSKYLRAISIGPCTGREVAKRMGLGLWRSGALYVNLNRLEESGLIESEGLLDGTRKYTVTVLGQHNLEQESPEIAIATVRHDNWLMKLVKRLWRNW